MKKNGQAHIQKSESLARRFREALRRVRRGVRVALSDPAPDRDGRNLPLSMPIIDRHIAICAMASSTGLFDETYEIWRAKRINKILEIYGVDHFDGLEILELGCGHGDVGAFFSCLGANVLCVDGRIRNVNHARLKYRNYDRIRFKTMNLEEDFRVFGRFDLIINFGLLYHLSAIDKHLQRCFEMSDEVILESVVSDSTDPFHNVVTAEHADVDEESVMGMGCRPSPHYIERVAREMSFEWDRHFSADLNHLPFFCYDWPETNSGAPNDDFVNRRFWRFRRGQPSTIDSASVDRRVCEPLAS